MRILASVLSLDKGRFREGVELAELAGVDGFQLDVADGVFVDNLAGGTDEMKALRALTDLPVDAHLMVSDPFRLAPVYASLGADTVTVHVEASGDPELADVIREHGARPILALNPETPLEAAIGVLEAYDGILIMTVHPGFSGRGFLPEVMPKLRKASGLGLPLGAGVDGGVNDRTIVIAAENGASFAISSSFIFKGEVAERVRILREAVGGWTTRR